jgi:hypothetical protein
MTFSFNKMQPEQVLIYQSRINDFIATDEPLNESKILCHLNLSHSTELDNLVTSILTFANVVFYSSSLILNLPKQHY